MKYFTVGTSEGEMETMRQRHEDWYWFKSNHHMQYNSTSTSKKQRSSLNLFLFNILFYYNLVISNTRTFPDSYTYDVYILVNLDGKTHQQAISLDLVHKALFFKII